MPPLPVVKQIEVRRALERAGFVVDHFSGSHARMVKGNREVTVPIHRGKDMARGTLRGILDQAGMTEDEFIHWLKA
jgi:predicted RNA binding protein YcfA (HicA-like mRNA interferase family)